MKLPDRPYAQVATRLFEVGRPIVAEALTADADRLEQLFDEMGDLRDAMPRPDDWEPDYAQDVRRAIQAAMSILGAAMVTRPGHSGDADLMAQKRQRFEEAIDAARERLARYYRSEKL